MYGDIDNRTVGYRSPLGRIPKGHQIANFDRVAEIYDSTRKAPEEILRATVSAMEKALAGRNTILDLGVGTGRYAKPLTERGFDVVGVDVSLGMMEKARARGLRSLVRADGHDLPFADASFQAVIIILFLHLADDWAKAVREIGRVCDGPILSIVGASSGPNVRDSYLEMRRKAGYPTGKLDEDAEGLRKVIAPRRKSTRLLTSGKK